MTTWFVTRHQGAIEWAKQQNIKIDYCIEHLEPEKIKKGDWVLGTLPINIVAVLNQQGARYFHLSLSLPADKRGLELTADELQKYQATLEEYQAIKL